MTIAAKQKVAYRSIKRDSVVKMILSNAKRGVTTVVQSHTGNSKSAIQRDLCKAMPNATSAILNMSQMQAGDLLMPKFEVRNERSVVSGVPHEQLGFHLDQPVILLLDEIFKAPKALQVQIADLVNEHRIGTYKLPAGSIVWGASNLETENFGDATMAYFQDRLASVEMAKVSGEEWIEGYALEVSIHPTIITAAKEYPSMFADYRDYSKAGENQYIFDPRQPQPHFVTLRSLERASRVLYGLEEIGMDVHDTTHALTNIVGARAAQDIMAVHILHEELPTWEDIVKTPTKAKVPKTAGGRCLLIYTALNNLDAKSIKPWMEYAKVGLKKEEQALFASSILKIHSKAELVSTHTDFIKWAKENSYLNSSS